MKKIDNCENSTVLVGLLLAGILLVMGGYRIFSYLCDRGAVDTATYLLGAAALVLTIFGLLLASRSFSNVKNTPESIRVRKVEEHIDQNFKQEIRLKTLSDIAGMTPAAFSRYFRMKTGKTVSDYIIDIRLGHAARQLVDTTNSVADICYDCGFNNISNFNRIFKKKKGCSPTAFRENYHKRRIIV